MNRRRRRRRENLDVSNASRFSCQARTWTKWQRRRRKNLHTPAEEEEEEQDGGGEEKEEEGEPGYTGRGGAGGRTWTYPVHPGPRLTLDPGLTLDTRIWKNWARKRKGDLDETASSRRRIGQAGRKVKKMNVELKELQV
jgi:hypothetical protein